MFKKESKPFSNESVRKIIRWATIPMLGALSLTACGGGSETSAQAPSASVSHPKAPTTSSGPPSTIPEKRLINECLDEPTSWSTNFDFPPAFSYSPEAQKDLNNLVAGAANSPDAATSQYTSGAESTITLLPPGTQLLNGPHGEVVATVPAGDMIEVDCPISSTESSTILFQIKNSPNPNQWYWLGSTPGYSGGTGPAISEKWQSFEQNDLVHQAPNGQGVDGSGLLNYENNNFYFDTQSSNEPKVRAGYGIMEQYNPLYWTVQYQ